MGTENNNSSAEIQDQKQEESFDPMLEAFKRGVPEISTIKSREKADVDKSKCSRVTFVTTHTVFEREQYVIQTHSRIRRGPHDQWREYGALKKICNIGGWKIIRKGHDKKSVQYQYVPAGSLPPNPPNREPINALDEFLKLSASSMQTGKPQAQDKT